jgi:hypothetical protein
MTMQNLDVHGTFRDRPVNFLNRCQINDLLATRPRKGGSLGADQVARYSVDLINKNPLVPRPCSTASHLFLSCVGTTPSTQHAYSGRLEPTRPPVEDRDGGFTASRSSEPAQKRPVGRQ